MNPKIGFSVLMLLLFIAPVSAQTLSLSISSYDTEVYKGSQFVVPITVSVQNLQTSGTISVTIAPKSGLSCDTCTNVLSFSTSGSTTTSFTLTADEKGTYESPFTITASLSGATPATATGSDTVVVKERASLEVHFYNTSAPIKVGTNLWEIPIIMEITTSDTDYSNVIINLADFVESTDLSSGPQNYTIDYIPAHSHLTLTWVLNATHFSVYGLRGTIMTDKGTFDVPLSEEYTVPSVAPAAEAPVTAIGVTPVAEKEVSAALPSQITVGESMELKVTVKNTRSVQEPYKISFPDLPSGWTVTGDTLVTIPANGEKVVTYTLSVPSTASLGTYTFTIKVEGVNWYHVVEESASIEVIAVVPVATTVPPVVTTAPPVVTTAPPVTAPPVVTTVPPIVTTAPPIVTTAPPVVTTAPPTTAPPVTVTPPKKKYIVCGPTAILILLLIPVLVYSLAEKRKIGF